MTGRSDESDTIGATQRSFEVLEALCELNGGRVSEVARYLDIASSTAYSHLSTLHHLEYVIKKGDTYHVGGKFLMLGQRAVERNPVHPDIEDILQELAEETQERVQFCVQEHGLGVFLDSVEGKHGIRIETPIGAQVHLHQTATGKAILASLPRSETRSILDRRGLPASTENTITDREALLNELEVARTQGYALNREEFLEGVNAIGAAIQGQHGEIVGALGVAGPAHRLNSDVLEAEYSSKLLGIVNELEVNLKSF